MTDPNKKICEMVFRYYRVIDSAAPVAELETFLAPEGFELAENDN